jgi:hypothetical protein
MRIERLRHTIAPGGERTVAEDVVLLAAVSAAELERVGAAAGLEALPGRYVEPTEEHVGSEVVLLRG